MPLLGANKSVSTSESVIAGCRQEDTGTFACGVLPSEVVENRHNIIVLTKGQARELQIDHV